jgi:hypothetical protein
MLMVFYRKKNNMLENAKDSYTLYRHPVSSSGLRKTMSGQACWQVGIQEGILAGRQADLLLFSPPQKSLSFRRTGNQLFVTSSKMGTANVTSKMISL